ncbi:MAG TPA: FAD-binding protein, partial [Ottowia sp.]|nr:FAD-binding protein [Ottowia sp.]
MFIERNVSLQPLNSFGIAARAARMVRVRGEDDVRAVLADAELAAQDRFVLGGGSNIVLTGDVKGVVLKVEVAGRRVLAQTGRHTIVEAGAGENWHDFVGWTLQQGLPGLENLALIPGTVGASPVQNIGAYGVELQDRFHELDAIDLASGEVFTLNAAQCGFGYRDSVFKHAPAQPGDFGLAGRALILRVRLALPRAWQPVLSYLELERKAQDSGISAPDARQIHDWIVAIRRAKLPDPAVI